jgi:hypothetical protein
VERDNKRWGVCIVARMSEMKEEKVCEKMGTGPKKTHKEGAQMVGIVSLQLFFT